MDKMVELENSLLQTLSGYENLEAIGFSELNALIDRIDAYKNEAYAYATDMFSDLTRNENGKFVAKNNMEFDIHEIAVVSSAIDAFTDKTYAEIHRLHVEKSRKSDLFLQKGRRVNELNSNKRINLAHIAKCEAEIRECEFNLTGELVKTNEALRNLYESKKALNLSLIESLKNANEMCDIEIDKLTNEMAILKDGGILDLNENFDLDRQAVNENNLTLDNKEETPNLGENDENKDLNVVTPVLTGDNAFADGYTDPNAEELPVEPTEENGMNEEVIPEEPLDEEIPQDENEDDNDLGVVSPILPGDNAFTDGDTDLNAEELPEEPIDENGLDEEVIPEEPVDEVPENDEIIPEEPVDEDEDKVVPVVSCTTPKQSLLKKLALIIGAAVAALGSIASMAHLALHINEHSEEATEEESQITEDEKEEVPEQTPEVTPETTPEVTPDNTPEETPEDTPENTPEETPEDTPEETPEDTPEDIPEDTPSPLPGDSTVFPIELGSGEVAYNEETGVEVTQDGSAYLHEEDGTTHTQEDRDLIETDHDTSVVIAEDLMPDEGPTIEEQLESIPQTGEEQTYEEAIPELTEGEKENLDQAFADWEAYFNESFTNGSTLTP